MPLFGVYFRVRAKPLESSVELRSALAAGASFYEERTVLTVGVLSRAFGIVDKVVEECFRVLLAHVFYGSVVQDVALLEVLYRLPARINNSQGEENVWVP